MGFSRVWPVPGTLSALTQRQSSLFKKKSRLPGSPCLTTSDVSPLGFPRPVHSTAPHGSKRSPVQAVSTFFMEAYTVSENLLGRPRAPHRTCFSAKGHSDGQQFAGYDLGYRCPGSRVSGTPFPLWLPRSRFQNWAKRSRTPFGQFPYLSSFSESRVNTCPSYSQHVSTSSV